MSSKNLEYAINQLEMQIVSYHSALNKQGSWLLLATIGCAGLQGQRPLQILAYIMVFVFYVLLSLDVFRDANGNKKIYFDAWNVTILKAIQLLREEIEQAAEGAEKELLRQKLNNQCIGKLRFWKMRQYNYLWLAFIFWGACVFYSIFCAQ
ncbi:MAG: hypothetical protein Q4G28_08300 [Neisseria sp.]|nr:hypothetical protein [Neisseria sp.]